MDALGWVHTVLLLLHLLGFAAGFGGLLAQARQPEPMVGGHVVAGVVLQLLSGVALAVLAVTAPEVAGPPDGVRAGVGTGLTLLLTMLVVANRRFASVPRGLLAIMLLLSTSTAVVAVLWR